MIHRHDVMYYVTLATIFLFAIVLQYYLPFSGDVDSLLAFTEQLVQGGKYYYDFYTPNPPLILLLYTPTVVISNLLGVGSYIVLKVFVFMIAIASFLICCWLYRRVSSYLQLTFALTLFTIYLLVPNYHFGQREHLLILLVMPYLLLATLRVKELSLNYWQAAAIGIMAGLGFGLKPQFLIAFIAVELYLLLRMRRLTQIVRPETLGVVLLLVSYLIFASWFMPEYLKLILPRLEDYYLAVAVPWKLLVLNPQAVFCWLPIIILPLQSELIDNDLEDILFILLLSFLWAYYQQQTNYFYHILPAFSVAILILSLQLMSALKRKLIFLHAMLGGLIIFFLLLTEISYYAIGFKLRHLYQILTAYLQHYPINTKILFISPRTGFYSLNEYNQIPIVQRYDALWLLNGLGKNLAVRKRLLANNRWFASMVTNNVIRDKPDLVFIEMKGSYRINPYYDALNYLNTNILFRNIWRNYQFKETLRYNLPISTELAVYTRIQ